MMKKIILILGFIVLFSTQAFSQYTAPTQYSMSAFVGYTKPTGDFANVYDGGINYGAEFTYYINRNIGIFGNFTYNRLQTAENQQFDYEAGYVETTVGTRMMFGNQSIKPFGEVGVGLYNVNETITNRFTGQQFEQNSKSDVGLSVGAGVSFPVVMQIDGFVKGRYNHVFTGGDGTQYFGVYLGGSYNF
jgi:opacity protein-like surface antigen